MSVALRAPGWWRALAYVVLGVAFSYGLSIGARALFGDEPLLDGESVLTIGLIAVPFFFLVGLGCFDYWFYWAAGRPTRPEDHSGHGAYSWRDYFRPNTDHKVIGIQYVVTSFFFLFVGGLLAMLMRAELAALGR
jgi:cytochrome c oxidase subunit I